jgi:hypothetical protein
MPRVVVLATVAALAAGAGGAPSAKGAAANSIIGAATNVTPPDEQRSPSVKIEGKITAASHRFAYRQCRIGRDIHIEAVRISGAVREEGDTYPTTKSGHFDYGPTQVDYGGTDSSGFYYDGYVPWEGGNATFILSTPKIKVPRDRLGFRSFTCRPLHLTLQVAIPPIPGGPP